MTNKEKFYEMLPKALLIGILTIIVVGLLIIMSPQERAEREAKVAEIDEKLKSVCTMHCELIEMQYYSSYISTDFSLESTRCRCLNREHELIHYMLDKDGIFIKRGI